MVRRHSTGATAANSSPASALARRLGIPPAEAHWLEQALTHRSYTRERGHEERESNERLEFLGDAVAQFVVSLLLHERYPRWSEGQLTRARSAVVSKEPLFRAATRLGLGEYLRLAKTEDEMGGRSRASILASAFEAVIAAVYLTLGIEEVTRMIRQTLGSELEALEHGSAQADFKTRLQEMCQSLYHKTPRYRLAGAEGPDHDKVFTAEVLLEEEVLGSGEGRSRRGSEQAAAEQGIEEVMRRSRGNGRTEPLDA